ncbi:MAG: hypothetical protein IJ043_03020 [Clostridia bacterium]|nr:hypothetical protein [Clostridia bacterium]
MKEVFVNCDKPLGKIKPMHAVNNGPVYKFAEDQRITNMDAYKAAGIPYARTHDASFYATYGGEHTVDVHAIFPNFDADPYDPASYDFCLTDEYLRVIEFAGTETYYRLGSKIEHWPKKYGTLPPKDFKKWAIICEHIIRHYTEGWADGFKMKITYWEIWNEPDLDPDDSTHKRCWGGTEKEFFELYDIAAKHLKACFPHLKIGGPALAGKADWAERFLAQLKAPLDFFSWHVYGATVEKVAGKVKLYRELLDRYGYQDTESILNEWNYVTSFHGEDWLYSLRMEKSLKGAAFIASVMSTCQKLPLDMLMYYDARPCGMNGMFCTDFVCDCLKGYYPFYMFNTLYQLGTEVESVDCGDTYVCAAKNGKEAAIMVSRFCEEDDTPAEEIKVTVSGMTACKAEYYLLDEEHDLTLVREEAFTGDSFTAILPMTAQASYLIKLKA